ncbi:hypothetical protein C2E21_4424 [Chlorella sorokiniana]|uniref:Uncharacterized protein n=1 Tax=Chlorella sorokiniana TaxID=3076 RepID=A0A2P6TRN5_CHLSO|nr:hypothetical protein C2E21_4424 [Chlorella sorokiniana]|eukprot:PRW56712.1 hypothetical protein C2E21_4424 [Chlorella sorokiniana]
MARQSALGKLKDALARVGIKAPWAYTGPLSSPEYLNHLPRATEYRRIAPVSQPLRASIPQSETDRVYDIKYYVRDSRRAHLPGGSIKLERGQLDVHAKIDALEALPAGATPNQPAKWKPFRPILENDNNGYTL